MSFENRDSLAAILCAVLASSSGSLACSTGTPPSDGGAAGQAGTPGAGDGGAPGAAGKTGASAGEGGMPGAAGEPGASGAGGASGAPPTGDDSLCGKRPGGVPFGDHVLRFETAAGDIVQLARAYEGSGAGESSLYGLDGMALRVNGDEICVGAGDTLEYTNTHHNWNDVARGSKDGLRYEMTMNFDGEDTLAIYDQADSAILSPTALIQTGAPPFCSNCTRRFVLGISEVLVSNTSFYADEGSEYEPLIELFNTGSDDIDLTGWTLSDAFSDRRKWSLPSLTLPRHETLVIFADGDTSQGSLHASFELSAAGGQLVLTGPDGRTDGGFSYGPQAPGESLAFSWTTGGYETVATPTPGEPPPE